MSPLWPFVAFAGALIGGMWSAARAVREAEPGDLRTNYRGAEVPAVLGGSLVRSAGAAASLALVLALLAGPVRLWPVAVAALAGTFVLGWAGRLDDRSASVERGLAGHARSLLRGRITTGIVKLVVGVAAAAGVAIALGGGVPRIVLSTIVVALSINVTNALDVRPGRAMQWALVILVVGGLFARGRGLGIALVASAFAGAGLAVWTHDLRERGMLGDEGSNPLGFVAGSVMVSLLPMPWLGAAALVLAALQVAAETVTISRLIETVPPIRWFDRLGRRE